MIIRHNINALYAHRNMINTNKENNKGIERLSSGMRINRGADDAAGLSISEKMRAQIRGLNQSARNIQDSVSMVQTIDGALNEVHELLQRGRELSVQASSGTYTSDDKQALQDEVVQINSEIDKISTSTQFNSIALFKETEKTNPGNDNISKVMEFLKKGWLEQSEKLVKDYYGLEADGADLKIKLSLPGNPGGALAWVSGKVPIAGPGKSTEQELHIDMADFDPPTWPNGGSKPMYSDRIIAHEMTHAIMGRSMNFAQLNTWFKEGTAEFIHGADERLKGDIQGNGGGTGGLDAIIGYLDENDPSKWIPGGADGLTSSSYYSASYIATRYLHEYLKHNGYAEGIKSVMNYLTNNQTAKLGDALNNLIPAEFADASTAEKVLLQKLKADYNADKNNFLVDKCNIKLDVGEEVDTGAIGGADADAGTARSAESVVPDIENPTDDPLKGYKEIWPDGTVEIAPKEGKKIVNSLKMQLGANINQSMDIDLFSISTYELIIKDVDLTKDAQESISKFDSASKKISKIRSYYGSVQNRLEKALDINKNSAENLTAAESRIRDVDMAKEMMGFSKNNILQQASQAMLAQAKQAPQGILQLLR